MSWLFSQALVEEYSEANSLDGAPCALWSGTPTPQACSWLGKTTGACRLSRSGMMFKHLTDTHGEAVLMSFLVAFPAPTFPALEREQASTEKPVQCGDTWPGSLAKFDPASSLWRTHQCLLFEDSTECLETFPRWGSMRDGELWELTTPEHLTSENESGLWPTPTGQDNPQVQGQGKAANHSKRGTTLGGAVRMWPPPCASEARQGYQNRNNGKKGTQESLSTKVMNAEKFATPQSRDWRSPAGKLDRWNNPDRSRNLNDQIGGQLNPNWVEWLMGWPIGWTDLKLLAMDKFHQWQHSHGEF